MTKTVPGPEKLPGLFADRKKVNMNYKDKVCVVTGASSGMGLATAKLLVDMGAKVYALNRRPCPVEGIAASICVDLTDVSAIDHAFEEIPSKIDCFFGIAGLSGLITDYKTTFNVNYTANLHICEKYMKRRMKEGGAIVLVTSTAGIAWKENIEECEKILELSDWESVQQQLSQIIPPETPSQLAYMYSKRLATAYSAKLAVELAPKGIRVNAVLSGSIMVS